MINLDNLAIAYLHRVGLTLADFEEQCIALAREVTERHEGTILVVVPVGDRLGLPHPTRRRHFWSFHAAPVVGGMVHDPWFHKLILPPVEYAAKAFGGDLELHFGDAPAAFAVAKAANERARPRWDAFRRSQEGAQV